MCSLGWLIPALEPVLLLSAGRKGSCGNRLDRRRPRSCYSPEGTGGETVGQGFKRPSGPQLPLALDTQH